MADPEAQAASIAHQQEHYGEDRAPALLAASAMCIIFIVISVAMRFYAQSMIGKTWAADMWLIAFAAVIALAVTAGSIVAIHNGLGKHQLRVQNEDPSPPSHTLMIFQMGYVVTILQSVGLMTTKLSILIFYRRVFTTRHKAFKIALYLVATFSLILGIASTIEFIVRCVPPQLFWERVYLILGSTPPKPLDGWCMPQTLHLVIPLIADLVSEIAILILPVIGLWKVQLPMRKKMGLFFAFSLGIFVTAISIIRLNYAYRIENAGDISWDNADTFIWTAVQVSFGVTCASVPAMAPIYRLFRSKHWSASANYGPRSGTNNSGTGICKGSRKMFHPPDDTRWATLTDGESLEGLTPNGVRDMDAYIWRGVETSSHATFGGPSEEDGSLPMHNIRVEMDISVIGGEK